MTTIDMAHTFLKAGFPLGLGMKRDPEVGVRGRTKGFRTERVEGVVCQPVAVRGNGLGVKSRTKGVESHHHLDNVVDGGRHCLIRQFRKSGRWWLVLASRD